jgi:tryptophan synthase alpha chain
LQPLATAVRAARDAGRPVAVPYVMVDRRRGRELATLLRALADAGATAVELGFPFSDPIADGPVLEAAADRALAHGTRWSDLLEQLDVASAHLPAAVMTYANPVLRHGLDAGVAALAQHGASGLIVPDLSFEEARPWAAACRSHGLSLVLLAAPAASPARVEEIAKASHGFLYMVSRYGTTGTAAAGGSVDLRSLFRAAHRARPDLPILLGFGVRDRATARAAMASGADGVIVGSALQERLDAHQPVRRIGSWFGGIAAETARRPVIAGA